VSARPHRPRLGLLTALSVVGLFLIEQVYTWVVPPSLQIGHLLMVSFAPLTYPLGYWIARLLLTVVFLGPVGYLCGARRWGLLAYLLAGFLLALHGPLFAVLVQIYLPR
jgi:hypothetical protein